jgi:hypothetical protein
MRRSRSSRFSSWGTLVVTRPRTTVGPRGDEAERLEAVGAFRVALDADDEVLVLALDRGDDRAVHRDRGVQGLLRSEGGACSAWYVVATVNTLRRMSVGVHGY